MGGAGAQAAHVKEGESPMKRAILYIAIALVVCPVAAVQTFGRADYMSAVKPSDQPINIKSKRFVARNVSKGVEFTFSKDVRVKQADLTLTCDKLVIVYDEKTGKSKSGSGRAKLPTSLESLSGIRAMTASGKVKMVQGERIATSGKARYDHRKRTLTLTEGPPRLWQGADRLVADTIIIYLDENRSELKGGKDGEIHMTIDPKKKTGDKKKKRDN